MRQHQVVENESGKRGKSWRACSWKKEGNGVGEIRVAVLNRLGARRWVISAPAIVRQSPARENKNILVVKG